VNTQLNFESILNQVPGICFIKDRQSKYIWVNPTGLAISGLNMQDIVGRDDYDLPWYSVAGKFIAQDKKAMEGCIQYTLERRISADGPHHNIIMLKKSVYLSQSKAAIGSLAIGFELNFNNHNQYLSYMNLYGFQLDSYLSLENSSTKEFVFGDLKFSRRQAQILGYILRGYSALMIAEQLQLSKRTVEFYINNIKDKLGCNKRTEIIELAYRHNFIGLMFLNIA